MKTVTIQIGNTDDKLVQRDWAAFVKNIDALVCGFAERVHFFGAPPNYAEWQNATWVFDIEDAVIPTLKDKIAKRRKAYMQDSAAWTEGETEFI